MFACKEKFDQASVEKCQNQKAFLEGSQKGNRRHNKELIKEEEKKEENLYKHNACEDKNEFLKKAEKPKKIWYPIEQIEKVEFPNAERILYTWQKFSGQTNVQIIPLLRQYCKEQKDIDILQMTLDVLDYRFRKYMKQHFKISKQVVEPVRKTNYIRIEE